MFLGTYTPKLDDKGRLFLPAKFREELMAGLVVTTGQERCLTVYKLGDFAEIAARVQAAPITVKGARDYGRFLGANANQDTPDKQGRITITPMQRDYAALTKDVMVLGRDQPDRDLGPRSLGVLQPAEPGDLRRHQRRGLPRPLGPLHPATRTAHKSTAIVRRGLSPLTPTLCGTFPGSRR